MILYFDFHLYTHQFHIVFFLTMKLAGMVYTWTSKHTTMWTYFCVNVASWPFILQDFKELFPVYRNKGYTLIIQNPLGNVKLWLLNEADNTNVLDVSWNILILWSLLFGVVCLPSKGSFVGGLGAFWLFLGDFTSTGSSSPSSSLSLNIILLDPFAVLNTVCLVCCVGWYCTNHSTLYCSHQD